ncbi:MAG: YIP1 family protein [Bacillota bacterium]|nr:MAG: hypothetical protein DIU55_10770 [Bacillota bacterium]
MRAATTPPSPWLLTLRYWWEPGEVFRGLRTKPAWFPAYLLTASLMAAGTLIAYSHVTASTREALSQAGVAEGFLRVIMTSTSIGLALTPLVSPLIAAVLVSYLLLLVGIFMGAPVRFGQLFSLAMWSFVPFQGLRFLVQGIVAPLAGVPAIDAVDLSLAVLLPATLPAVALAVASQIDPFYLWSLGLLTLGYATMFRRSRKEALAVSFLLMGVRTVLTVLILRADI